MVIRYALFGSRRVWSLLIGMAFALLPGVGQTADSGNVRISPQEVMLGEAVTVYLRGASAAKQFDNLDLNAFRSHFAIGDVAVESDRARLRLYPLRTGKAVLRKQDLPGLHLPETFIQVSPNPDVDIEWQPLQETLFAKQNALWRAKVTLDRANLAWFEGRDIEALEARWQIEVKKDAVKVSTGSADKTVWLAANYQFQPQWSESSESAARLWRLPSPVLVVKHAGGQPWRFFSPARLVEVEPLPSFLPFNVAVGEVAFTADGLPWWRTVGEMGVWQWTFSAQKMDKEALKALADQLVAQLGTDAGIAWLTEDKKASQTLTDQGLQSRLTVTIPYRVLESGWLSTPELKLRVFDPDSGKLRVTTIDAQSRFAVPVWMDWILKWLLLIWVMASGFTVLWLIKQFGVRWRLRRSIQRAQSVEELVRAMQGWQGFQSGEQVPLKMTTLGRFNRCFTVQYGRSAELDRLIEAINRSCYAPSETLEQGESFHVIQDLARAWVKRVPLVPRFKVRGRWPIIFPVSERCR